MTWSEWVLPSLACFWLLSPYLPLTMFVWWVTKLHGNGLTYLPSLGLDRLEALTKNLGLATEAMQDGKLSQGIPGAGKFPPLPGNRYMGHHGTHLGRKSSTFIKCRLTGRCLVPSFGGFFCGRCQCKWFWEWFLWILILLCSLGIFCHLLPFSFQNHHWWGGFMCTQSFVYIYIYLFIYSIFTDLCYYVLYIYIYSLRGLIAFCSGFKRYFS